MFTNLHTHSYYSLLRGVSSPASLVSTAAETGASALALTDHSHLSGIVEFTQACETSQIRPVIGLEVLVNFPRLSISSLNNDSGVLVLLAMNEEGWKNLCKISSQSLSDINNLTKPSVEFETLSDHSGGLICLTGGVEGLLDDLAGNGRLRDSRKHLDILADLYPDRLYIEMQKTAERRGALLKELSILSQETEIPAVATDSIYYISPSQETHQRTLSAIRINRPVHQCSKADFAPAGSFFSSQQQIEDYFHLYPEAVSNKIK